MDAIAFDCVSKSFGQRRTLLSRRGSVRTAETVALANLCLRIPQRVVQVLLGPNGSGKTTLLKLISTVLLPDAGTIQVAGHETTKYGAEVRKLVGFAVASERSFYPRLTARENLDFFAALEDVHRRQRSARVDEVLQTVDLAIHGDKQVMHFSSGMYQRLGIARALLKNPAILLLDEPSRSLDPRSAARLWGLIDELSCRGCTVVLATHSFEEAAAIGQSVAVLLDGRLVDQSRALTYAGVEALRDFYFEAIGERAEYPEFANGQAENRALAR